MTQVFTGEGLGLQGSSLGLGNYGPKGIGALGQGGHSAYVNAANGNMVLKQADGFLADIGFGLDLFQTYNSQGEAGSSWRFNVQARLEYEGEVNTAGSTVTRIGEDGHRSRFVFNAQQQAYLSEDGSTARITCNAKGWTYREGAQKTVSHYTIEGQLTDISDMDGHSIYFSYQKDGQLECITDSSNKQQITWTFNKGLLQEVTTRSEGRVIHQVRFEYDESNRLHKVDRDLGQGNHFWITYDYAGDSNRITDINQSDGTALHIDYDEQGRVKTLRDGEGRTSTYVYGQGMTTITNDLGESWTYSYDDKNRLTGIDGPLGYRIRYQYEGMHLSRIIQGNQVWTFTYNEAGDCIRMQEPSGQVINSLYDEEHRLLAQTRYQIFDANHHPTKPFTARYVYDKLGHLLFAIAADGVVTEYRYDEQGLLSSSRCYIKTVYDVNSLSEDARLSFADLSAWCAQQKPQEVSLTEYRYDWRGQLLEEIKYNQVDALGEGIDNGALITCSLYDASGRLIERSVPTDSGWHTTYYLYDDLGRLIQTKDNQQHSQRFEYDDAHQRVIQTDANGLQTINVYDRSGLLLCTTRLDASHAYGCTRYQYDEAGRLVAQTGVDGLSSYSFYDLQGRLQATVNTQGLVTEYRYNDEGLLLQTHQYECAVATKDWLETRPDFDSIKPQSSAQDRNSQIVYNQYNQIAYRIDAQGAVIAYTYDAQGQVVCAKAYANRLADFKQNKLLLYTDIDLVDDAADRSTFFYYDTQGRLQAQVNGEGYAIQYHYDALGHLTQTCRYANPVVKSFSGDWSKDQPVTDNRKDIRTYSLYDGRGLKVADIDGEGYVTEYIYDTRGLLHERYAYATALLKNISIDENTQLDQIRPAIGANDHHNVYTYNELGLLVEERTQGGLITSYVYDEMNQLISKTLTDVHSHKTRQQRYRYDALGRVTQSLNEKGAEELNQSDASAAEVERIWQQHSTRYAYDDAGLLLSQTNALNQSTRYFYDNNKQLRYTLNADGGVTESHYTLFGELEQTIKYSAYLSQVTPDISTQDIAERMALLKDARFDEVTSYQYNTLGQRIALRAGTHGLITTDYNSFGEVSSSSQYIDANHQQVTTWDYDKRGLLNDSWDGLGQKTSRKYDAFSQVIQQTDGRLNTTRFMFNKRGEQIILLRADNAYKKTSYDAFGRILSETDFTHSKFTKIYEYDDQNNSLTLNNPNSNTQIITEFNAFGDTLSVTDARGYATVFQYDEQGLLIRTDSPEQAFKAYHYDELGQLIWQENAQGQIIQYQYDATGHLLSQTIDPKGLKLTTSYQYDALGRQLQVTDANGCITQFTYDNQGRLIQSCLDPKGLNVTTNLSYDARGLLIRQTVLNPQGSNAVTAYEWDVLGRKTAEIRDPDGLNVTTTYQYDANDNLIAQTDAKRQRIHLVYDALNRCRYQIDARGVVTEHVYNVHGYEEHTVTYAKTIDVLDKYDITSVSAVLQQDDIHNQHQFRTFNNEGQVINAYDGMGFVTKYSYDDNGNMLSQRRYAQAVSVEALKRGERPTPASEGAMIQRYAYDGLNQLRIQCSNDGYITQLHYDLSGQLIKSTRYSSAIILADANYSLDNLLEHLTPNAALDQSTQYAYDKAKRLVSELSAGGVVKSYQYDSLGQVVSSTVHAIRQPNAQLADLQITSSPDDRTQHYVYDAAGHERYRISSEGRVLERCYDALGNVIQERTHAIQINITDYNEVNLDLSLKQPHEIRRTVYTYDALGRLTNQLNAQNNATGYTYDAQGNVLTKIEVNGGVWHYAYNVANQLIETRSPLGIVTSQSYDSFGNVITLIQDAEGIQQTQYYEYNANNQKIKIHYPKCQVNNATRTASNQRQESTQTLTEEVIYNAFGQVSSSCDKAGNWTHNTYDKQGLLQYHLNSQGALTHYQYDGFGRLTTKTTYATSIVLPQDADVSAHNIEKARSVTSYDRHEYYEYTQDNQLNELRLDATRQYTPTTGHYDIHLQPTTQHTYNSFGELIQTATRINESQWANTIYYYDKDGHQTAKIDAEGYLTTMHNNAFGEVDTTTEYALAVSQRDTQNYVLPQTSTKDRIVTFVYDALGQVTQKTLKQVSFQRLQTNGHAYETLTEDLTTYYEYDALGHLTATTDAQGHRSYCYYDVSGQLIATVAPTTQTGQAATTYSYDALGHLLEKKRWAEGATEADVNHFVLKSASNQDISTRYEYDQQGQLTAEFDGLNYKTNYSYDANGNCTRRWKVLSQIDGGQLIQDTRYLYDSEHHLLQTANFKSDGSMKTEDAQYNVFGELTAKGINGQFVTHVEYDRLGRVWRSNTEGYYQIFVYDLMNNLTQVVTSTSNFGAEYDENGVDLSHERFDDAVSFDLDAWRYDLQRQDNSYDALGHLLTQGKRYTVTNKDKLELEQIMQSQTVDRWGNCLSTTNAKGYQTRYDYNAFNQMIRQELPEMRVVDAQGVGRLLKPVNTYAYDELGRAIAMTDAENHTVGKRYDAQGRVIQEIDAKGNVRAKQYNLLDQLSQASNELGAITHYTYDANNRLVSVKTTNTKQDYIYNEDGQLIQQNNAAQEKSRFWYDTLGNQIKQSDVGGKETYYEYDDAGHKTKQTDATGRNLTWNYSPDGRLIEHTDLGGHRTNYRYNSNGLVLEEQSSAGKHIKYHYQGDGQLAQYVDEALHEVVNYKYDAQGQLISKEGGRSGDYKDGWMRETDYYQYDALGRLVQVRRRNPEDTDRRFPEKDHALLSIDYEYDAVGNIRHTQVSANYTGYTQVNSDDYYTYDENNRMTTNKGQLIDGHIQMSASQGSILAYDAAGNIQDAKKMENGAIQNYHYQYNQDNQLELIQKNNRSIQAKAYDAAGRVVREHLFDESGSVSQKNIMSYEQGLLVAQSTKNAWDSEVSKANYSYDAAGNMTDLNLRVNGDKGGLGFTTHHHYSYALWEGYQQSLDEASQIFDRNPNITYGQSIRTYDVNGQLKDAIDVQVNEGNRNTTTHYWSSALDGIKAREDQDGQTSYLTVAGKTIGDIHLDNTKKQQLNVYGGFTPSGSQQKNNTDFKGNLFNQLARSATNRSEDPYATTSYMQGERTNNFLGRSAGDIANGALPESTQDNLGAYTLQAGDTLESVALTVYGDSSLWYLLADANGISDKNAQASNGGSIHIGQRINLPAVSTGTHQTNATHKVLGANHKIGNTSATMPMPPPPPPAPQKHHLMSILVVAVVAVVAAVLTAGVIGALATGSSLTGGLGALFTIGTKVLAGSVVSTMGTMASGFAVGFVGSIASQGAATFLGMQDHVDLNSALLSGLTSAATAGIAKGFSSLNINKALVNGLEKFNISKNFNVATAADMMVQNVASQSLNLAIRRHQHFAWDELAISGLTAGVMKGSIGEKITDKLGLLDKGTNILNRELNALTSSTFNSAITGKTFDAAQVIIDNLGSAIGSAITDFGTKEQAFTTHDDSLYLSDTILDIVHPERTEEVVYQYSLAQEASASKNNDLQIEEGAYTPIPKDTYKNLQEQYARYRLEERLSESESGKNIVSKEALSGKIPNFHSDQQTYPTDSLEFFKKIFNEDTLQFDGNGVVPIENRYKQYSFSHEGILNIQVNLKKGSKPQYTLKGSSTWIDAPREEVSQAMNVDLLYADPEKRLQFMDLHYQKGVTAEHLKVLLKGHPILAGKADVFLKAGEVNNINPIYLVSHALLETGREKTELSSNNNFFGVGAVDGKAVARGVKFAKDHGWLTPELGIMGAAEIISKQWINNPSGAQDTLYNMRWNPMNPGRNQYATDINWATKQTEKMNKLIRKIQQTDKSFQPVYLIPKWR